MILYTMIPQELIFPANNDDPTNEVVISYKGIPIIAQRNSEQEYLVQRILSTDLKHYMDPVCQPGAKISLQWPN